MHNDLMPSSRQGNMISLGILLHRYKGSEECDILKLNNDYRITDEMMKLIRTKCKDKHLSLIHI